MSDNETKKEVAPITPKERVEVLVLAQQATRGPVWLAAYSAMLGYEEALGIAVEAIDTARAKLRADKGLQCVQETYEILDDALRQLGEVEETP